MAFVICEGLDRTGKSSVANYYKDLGYEIIHLSAPDKKYSQRGYSGESYCDSLVDLLVSKAGKDVVFDRSWMGEIIWPYVYRRMPQLSEDDIELLREFEDQNSTTRILMHDPDVEAHWRRCVDNKEPLDKSQFNSARTMYYEMAKKYGFELKTINDFDIRRDGGEIHKLSAAESVPSNRSQSSGGMANDSSFGKDKNSSIRGDNKALALTSEQIKLNHANAINEVLSKRIVKTKGDSYDIIEAKIRDFLNVELGTLLGSSKVESIQFSKDEVVFLKTLISKAKGNK